MLLRNKTTGIIPDTHFPGHLEKSLEFIQDTFLDWGVTQVVHIGDVFDHHYMSRWPTEPDALNPVEEHKAAHKEVQRWVKAFPQMYICVGNHDTIPTRQAKTLGIPDTYLMGIRQIYDLPVSWRFRTSFKIYSNTLIDHGLGSGGMYGAKNTANKLGCSYVQGHTHSHASVFNLPRPFQDAAAMNVGCLIDPDKYHARYGKNVFKVPMSHGCGIIESDSEMYFVKM